MTLLFGAFWSSKYNNFLSTIHLKIILTYLSEQIGFLRQTHTALFIILENSTFPNSFQ